MSKLREIMNNQLNLVLEELDALEHGSERTKLRIMLIGALANTASIDFKDAPKGKDAIKEDTAKEVEEVIDDSIEKLVEETNNQEDESESVEVAEETVDQIDTTIEEEQETQIVDNLIVLNEEGQEVNITDAYNAVLYAANDEDRQALALQITEYMCLPAYQTLNELVVTNAEGGQELLTDSYYKFMLAYYLTPNEEGSTGLEVVDQYVEQFTDGQCKSTYEFINNDNIEAFIEWLSN